jgi:hypothetical protein
MIDSKTFSLKIEKIVCEKKIPYIEAIVHHCEQTGLEIETAAKLINTKIKQMIDAEATDLNMMKEKVNKLPL